MAKTIADAASVEYAELDAQPITMRPVCELLVKLAMHEEVLETNLAWRADLEEQQKGLTMLPSSWHRDHAATFQNILRAREAIRTLRYVLGVM